MGRIKEQLVDRPHTIGDMKRGGAVGVIVRCHEIGCGRKGKVSFDALKLPDDTPFQRL